jgi:hypothetical protein
MQPVTAAPIIIGHAEMAQVPFYSQATMDRIGKVRWFFSHASVGTGFSEGLYQDSLKNPTFYELTRFPCESNPPPSVAPGTFCDLWRGNPTWQTKIDWFSNYLAAGWTYPTVDFVMNKLGSVDPTADWTAYVASYLDLEAMYPATTFIYMTIPLTTDEDSDNILRNQFNNNLRSWVRANNRILLDDADAEAYDTNGVACTFTNNGVVYQKLWTGFSTDGTHPNIIPGQAWLAQMFYAVANAILTQRGPFLQARTQAVPATDLLVQWASRSNEVYTLSRSTNVDGPWEVQSALAAATPPWNYFTSRVDKINTWFYQVVAQPAGAVIIGHDAVAAVSQYPQAAMNRIGQFRWFYSHGSVGSALSQGLTHLHSQNPSYYPLTTVPCQSNQPVWLAAGKVADLSRGDPPWPAELSWFSNNLETGWRFPDVDLVISSLSPQDTNADWLTYANYVQMLETLYPATMVGYTTMPLSTNEDAANILRNKFNTNLRAWTYWNRKLLFDIADIESHDTHGAAYTFLQNSVTYQKLYPGFTSDGQSPNTPDYSAQDWLARGFYALANTLPASRLPVTEVRTQPGIATALLLQWPSHSNETFSVQTARDPLSGAWQTLTTNLLATPPLNAYTGSMGQAGGYFRVHRN